LVKANALGLSRMEIYLAVIKVLDSWDLITQKQIMRKAHLNVSAPKQYFDFLINLNLITEKTVGNKTVYSITEKGQKLCRYFKSKNDESIFGGTKISRID